VGAYLGTYLGGLAGSAIGYRKPRREDPQARKFRWPVLWSVIWLVGTAAVTASAAWLAQYDQWALAAVLLIHMFGASPVLCFLSARRFSDRLLLVSLAGALAGGVIGVLAIAPFGVVKGFFFVPVGAVMLGGMLGGGLVYRRLRRADPSVRPYRLVLVLNAGILLLTCFSVAVLDLLPCALHLLAVWMIGVNPVLAFVGLGRFSWRVLLLSLLFSLLGCVAGFALGCAIMGESFVL
jgi:hypothetical protein